MPVIQSDPITIDSQPDLAKVAQAFGVTHKGEVDGFSIEFISSPQIGPYSGRISDRGGESPHATPLELILTEDRCLRAQTEVSNGLSIFTGAFTVLFLLLFALLLLTGSLIGSIFFGLLFIVATAFAVYVRRLEHASAKSRCERFATLTLKYAREDLNPRGQHSEIAKDPAPNSGSGRASYDD